MTKFKLKLYVVGKAALNKQAIKNLTELCKRPELKDSHEFEVIDLLEHPQLAESEKIIATPILIREFPEPSRRIIGDLSDHAKVLEGLRICEIK
ncbi:MAG: circadian clock KaiB family protein [Gammaproteobacteria bacterium]|nr:circadian clock KaiB family protein [Gammaproteobacteria bacterium]